MRTARKARRLSAFAALSVCSVLALGAQGLTTTAAAGETAARQAAAVRPRAIGELDCNGLSPVRARPSPA